MAPSAGSRNQHMFQIAYAQPSEASSRRASEGYSADKVLTTAMNIAIAVVALIFLLPVMLLVALAVFAQDGGPVLFAHRRIGLNGRHFHCLKFRSMAIDA